MCSQNCCLVSDLPVWHILKTIIIQSPPHLWLWSWNASLCRNSAYTSKWTLLSNINYTAFPVMLLLLIYCIYSWREPLSIKLLHTVWNSGPTICITKSLYEMHISTFLMCKCEQHFTSNLPNDKQHHQSNTTFRLTINALQWN